MYVELHARSAFSFLEGSTLPEDLISVCAARGMSAMALLDRDGLYGSPRFHLAAKKIDLKAHIGAEVSCEGFSFAKRTLPPRSHGATENAKEKSDNASERAFHSFTDCHSERSEEPAVSRRSAPPSADLQSE